jgi:hypothetical protein
MTGEEPSVAELREERDRVRALMREFMEAVSALTYPDGSATSAPKVRFESAVPLKLVNQARAALGMAELYLSLV